MTAILKASDLVVLSHQRGDFETLRDSLLTDIQPVNSIQIELFNQLLRAAWQIRRCDYAERSLADSGLDPLLAKDKTIDRIIRSRAHSERVFRQALAELRKVQTDCAVRRIPQNQGLAALPVPIDTRTYIQSARLAQGARRGQVIPFPPAQAALDQVAREKTGARTAWHAWQKRLTPRKSTATGS